MHIESFNFRQEIRPSKPDVLNLYHEFVIEAQLRNRLILNKVSPENTLDTSIDDLMCLRQAYDSRLTLAIIDRRLNAESISLLDEAQAALESGRVSIAKRLKEAKPLQTEKNEAFTRTAQRLQHLTSLDTPHLLEQYCLVNPHDSKLFAFPFKRSAILKEALALLPSPDAVLGFKTEQIDEDTIITLFLKQEAGCVGSMEIKIGADEKMAA